MDDLCTACLCAGRKLYFIGETGSYNLYSQILNEIPVYDMCICVRICWECRERLRRFQEFKELVQASYSSLLRHINKDGESKLSLERNSRLQVHRLENHDFPVVVKDEPEDVLDIDGEDLSQEDGEVCEEDLKPPKEEPEPTARRKRSSAKTSKEKTKKKSKSKSKKVENKKINTKKKAPPPPEDTPEGAGGSEPEDFDDIDDDMLLEDVKVMKEKEVTKTKKTEAKSRVSKKKADSEQVKPNGVPPRAPSPELRGGKPTCGECGKVFSSKKTYRYHLNVLHRGQNRYPCPRCGKVYQWKSNLGRHMRTHKARDNGELFCSLCDKRFASVATYRQHLRVSRRHVSEAEFTFTCHECGKKFVNKTRLRDHVDWEHLNKIKFRCQLCDKPFKCHTSLYVHLQNVHRNKKKENLCHICGKSYQNAAKLKYHIVAMHTSETPYRCAHCAAAFGWYSSLYRHVREVHYKMKLQPKKMRKTKRPEIMPPPPPPL